MKPEAIEPAVDIRQGLLDRAPAELLVVCGVTVGSQALVDERTLFLGDELGRIGIVVDEAVREEGHQHSCDTFLMMATDCQYRLHWTSRMVPHQDSRAGRSIANLSPTQCRPFCQWPTRTPLVSCCFSRVVLVRRPQTHIGQDPAKSTSKTGAREEERDAVLPLLALVPHGEIVDDAREEAALGDAEEEARGPEPVAVVHDAEQRGDDAPGDGQRGQPEARGGALEDDVARDLTTETMQGQRGASLLG